VTEIYQVELDTNGRLILTPPANVQLTQESVDLGRKYRDLFDKIRFRVPATAGRASYQNHILEHAKIAFEDGDLQSGKSYIEEVDDDDLSIRYYKTSIDKNGELHLATAPWIEKPTPPEVRGLMERGQRALRKIRLVQKQADWSADFGIVESQLKHGFEDGEIANATQALQSFEDQFVSEKGPLIRKSHFVDTLYTAVIVIIITIAISILLQFRNILPTGINVLIPANQSLKMIPVIALGACFGIVFFAFIRNLSLTFESLGNFDAAQLAPWLRFTLVGVITVLLCVVMSAGLVKIEINELKLHEYTTNGYAAFLLGVLCGYSDTAIIGILTGVLDRKPS
jgi:hypothetical protein